jgi:hypothetical protein
LAFAGTKFAFLAQCFCAWSRTSRAHADGKKECLITRFALLWRGLTFLALCTTGAVAFDFSLRPRTPSAAHATHAATTSKWLDDFGSAQAVAKAEGKDILLQFARPSGSSDATTGAADPSITTLESDVFVGPISAAFVLLRLTATADTPPDQLAQIGNWTVRLAVTRFPTFVLLDSTGTPYARSELIAKSASEYQQEFGRLQKLHTNRDRELALAGTTKGIEQARHLDAVLTAVGPFADTEYALLEQRVTELDPHNAAGLRAKYEGAVTQRKIDRTMQSEVYPLIARGGYLAALARVDRLIVDVKPSRAQRQVILAFKGELYFALKDKPAAAKLLDEAIALDPKSEWARHARETKHQLAALQ